MCGGGGDDEEHEEEERPISGAEERGHADEADAAPTWQKFSEPHGFVTGSRVDAGVGRGGESGRHGCSPSSLAARCVSFYQIVCLPV